MSFEIDPENGGQRKLPLWDAIGRSYSTYFHKFQDVLRICWLWLAVVAPLTAAANWLLFSWMTEMMAGLTPGMPPDLASKPLGTTLLGYASTLVSLTAGLSIAVAWHRRIILDEHPQFSASNIATKNLWRYAWIGFAIFLIVGLPALIVGVLWAFLSAVITAGPPSVATLLLSVLPVLLVLAVGSAIALRLSLLLPARAVGDLDLTFTETWRGTRGNTWRIIWGTVACALLPLLVPQIALLGFIGPAMLGGESFAGSMTLVTTIFVVYYLLVLPIGVGFLSHAYWYFFGRS